jgi:hypothetical protein
MPSPSPDRGYMSLVGHRTCLCFILVSSSQPDYLVFHLFLRATGVTDLPYRAAEEEEGQGEEASLQELGDSCQAREAPPSTREGGSATGVFSR